MPLLGVGVGTTRGYGIIIGVLVTFGICGIAAYLNFWNSALKFTLKDRLPLLLIVLAYSSSVLSVWYVYYFAFIPVFAVFSRNVSVNKD
jgi:hypothetical protein